MLRNYWEEEQTHSERVRADAMDLIQRHLSAYYHKGKSEVTEDTLLPHPLELNVIKKAIELQIQVPLAINPDTVKTVGQFLDIVVKADNVRHTEERERPYGAHAFGEPDDFITPSQKLRNYLSREK